MGRYLRYSSHTVHELSVHIVFATKYRYQVLRGEIGERARDLIRQICDSQDVRIIKGVVAGDHVHLHLSRPPSLSESELVRRIKGRSGRKLLMEFPELKRRYWGGHFWGIGFGAWSSGNVTQAMINQYLEHHRTKPNDNEQFILEE
jgi:REP-associated tyrosine transposase